MRKMLFLVAVLLPSWTAKAGTWPMALAHSFNFSGQLLNASDAPLSSPQTLTLTILDPSQTCTLYEETQTVTLDNMGNFAVAVGAGTATANAPSGYTWDGIFQNNSAIPATICSGSSYTPAAGDYRYLKVTVADSALTAIPLTPVPFANTAETLQGLEPNEFLQVGTGGLTQASLQEVFTSTANVSTLMSLINGTSAAYVTSGASGVALPSFATNPSTPAAGDIWFNSTTNNLQYYNGSSVQVLSAPGGAISGTTIVATGSVSTPAVSATSMVLNDTESTPKTVTLKAPATISSSYSLTLPATLGISGQVLSTDATGDLSWVSGFSNGGNGFGTTAILGTTDGNPLMIEAGGTNAMVINPGGMILAPGSMSIGPSAIPLQGLAVSAQPQTTTSSGLVSLGNGPFDGASSGHFNGNSQGTILAINGGNSFEGTLINAQYNGLSDFMVDNEGNVTANGMVMTTGLELMGGNPEILTPSTLIIAPASTVQVGSSGTPFTAMGTCLASGEISNSTVSTLTCSGLPAETGLFVGCSPATGTLTAGLTVTCQSTGTAGSMGCTASVTNSLASWRCMWMAP